MSDVAVRRPLGFKVTLVTIAASVVTAIVYAIIYSSSRYMSWPAFGIMIAGAALAAVLIFLHKERFAPAVLLVCDYLSLLLYIYYIYFYISSVATGIQFSGFPLEFFVNAGLYAASLVLSVACVFMRQTNEK